VEIVLIVEAEIVEAAAVGIVVEVPAVAERQEVGAIVAPVVVAVAIAATAKTGSQALANSNWPLSYGFVLRWLIAILL
jgi:hypothetical protein